jgi:hypothetical protein
MNLGDIPLDPSQMKDIAQNGAPFALHAVGRLLGLGLDEQKALANGKIPWWTWLAGGLAVGFVAGARVQRMWPEKLPVLVRGK